MKFSVCLVLLVTVWQASAQAPGDEDSRCKQRRADANDVYPPLTKMLMDSRNYEELITGTRPHWQALDADGSGRGWRSSLGGLCGAEPRSCDYTQSASQNNWFFTQHIRYLEAREVFVNVSASFFQCSLQPSCNNRYVDVYRYERNERNDVAARTTSNYGQRIQRIQLPNGFIASQLYTVSFTFTPSGTFTGFYIGVSDDGTCVDIRRLQVYYRASPMRTDGLVIYPEIALPAAVDSNAAVMGVASSTGVAMCAANSVNLTSLQVTCFANGRCQDVAKCACNRGYEYLDSMPPSCRACTRGFYKAGRSNTACQACPVNTTESAERASICDCTNGHYRKTGEGPEVSCTAPPSSAQNVKTTVGNTTVEVFWSPPLSNGGRNDTYFVIKYKEVSKLGSFNPAGRTEMNECQNNGCNFTVRGLNPVTHYIIRVIAENGVSNQEPGSVDERTAGIANFTLDGIPGPPQGVDVVGNIVVVWQQPDQPNGNITGYEVGISNTRDPMTITNTIMINDPEKIFYVIQSNDVSTSTAYIQVRARTSAGSGPWSTPAAEFEPISTEKPTCQTTTPPVPCPKCTACPPTTPPCSECTACPPTTPPACPPTTPPACPPTTPPCPECTACPPTTPPLPCPLTTPPVASPTTGCTCPSTTPPMTTDATAVTVALTVGVTNDIKTDSDTITTPTDDAHIPSNRATDPTITTADTHSSTGGSTTDISFIALADGFLRVPLEVASGYVIITAVATFVITTVIILPFVTIITCICYRRALYKHKSKSPFRFSIEKNGT